MKRDSNSIDKSIASSSRTDSLEANWGSVSVMKISYTGDDSEAVDSAIVLPKPVAATTSPLSDRADLDGGSKETAHNEPTAIPVTVVAEGVLETSRKKKGQGKLPAVTKAVAQTTRFEQPSLTDQNDTLGDAGAQTAPTPTPFAASKAPFPEAKQRGESKGEPSGKATPKDTPKPEKPLFQGVKGPKNTSLQ
ncbi:unnamed protein product [Cuscuta campestris]|uniref:Uncharacterized protein n=1 Tax=Cuscuta campestris TaxID=132261 RepID=A0A484MZA0_9ASTE|nr:unnamed protein product [Cuscuta campestris]